MVKIMSLHKIDALGQGKHTYQGKYVQDVYEGLKNIRPPAVLAHRSNTKYYGTLKCSLVPRREGGGGESAWYPPFAHGRNYSKSHVVELGVCTNMTINGSREQHKPS